MLMRIAESHVRFGQFEHFYYRRQPEKVRELAAARVESVAICFMHSYRNDAHERRTRDILADQALLAANRLELPVGCALPA